MGFTITYVLGDSIYVNITNRCTNSCSFCVRNNPLGLYEGVDLWLDKEPTVLEIIESIKTRDLAKFKEIVFCGYGEPLIRAYDVFEVCKFIRQISNITIRVNTNGQANLIHRKNITRDMMGLFDICSISLNASTSQMYQNECKSEFGEDSLDGIIEFAKECKKVVPKVVFSVVDVMKKDEIENCRKIAESCGVGFRIRKMIN